jgi:hypothetical protein
MTGISVELSILLTNFVMAILFCLAVFLLAREFLQRPEYSLLAAFFVTLGARFVDTSYWDGSARGFMVVLAVLVLLALLRAGSSRRNLLVVVAVLLGFGCLATHHMAVLLVLFGVAYVIAYSQSRFLFKPSVLSSRKNLPLIVNSLIALVIIIASVWFFSFFWELALRNLQKTSLFDVDPVVVSVILNAGAVYANQIGLVAVFALLGIIYLLKDRKPSPEGLFLVSSILVFIPVLGNSLYVSMILSPFVSILGAFWFAGCFRSSSNRTRKVGKIILVLLAVASLIVPVWSIQKWNDQEYLSGKTVEVDNQVYCDAAYLRVNEDGQYAVSNINVVSLELAATTGTGFLDSGIYLVLNNDITVQDIRRNIIWSDKQFPTNMYEWFGYQNAPNVNYYVLGLMTNGLGFINGQNANLEAREYFTGHTNMLVVVDNNRPTEFVNAYSILDAALLGQLKAAEWQTVGESGIVTVDVPSYVTYESQGITLYMVCLLCSNINLPQ